MSFDGAKAVQDATGNWPVYPGHPLTVAWEIMSVFQCPDDALRTVTTGTLNCPEAVADNRISGGGGEVYRGCDLLRRAMNGAPTGELIEWADRSWIEGGAGGHVKAVQPGLDQANLIKPLFVQKLESWLSASARLA